MENKLLEFCVAIVIQVFPRKFKFIFIINLFQKFKLAYAYISFKLYVENFSRVVSILTFDQKLWEQYPSDFTRCWFSSS